MVALFWGERARERGREGAHTVTKKFSEAPPAPTINEAAPLKPLTRLFSPEPCGPGRIDKGNGERWRKEEMNLHLRCVHQDI